MTVRADDAAATKRKVTVAIRSISPEGLGAEFSDPVAVARRTSVTVDFAADGHRFEIPGRVAWVSPARVPGSPIAVGVQLQLTAATQRTRQEYARWIVELLKKQGL
jgi:hypothetical protein